VLDDLVGRAGMVGLADVAVAEQGPASTLLDAVRLADAYNHLYVLLPVLDDAKH
jgi:hypothetical protein